MKNKSVSSSPKRSETLRRILKLISPYRYRLILSIIFSLISTVLSLYIPILTGRAVDNIIENNVNFGGVFEIIVEMGVFIAVSALTLWIMTHINNTVTFGIVRGLREKSFCHIEKLPLSYLDTHPSGDVLSRVITDAEHITDGLLLGFTQLFSGVVTIVGTIVFMLMINPWITLVVVVLSPASFLIANFISKMTYKFFGAQSKTRGALTAYTEEMLDGIKTVKSFGYEKDSCDGFDKINEELADSYLKATFYSSTVNPSTRLMYSTIYAGVAIAGGIVAATNPAVLSIGMLSSFLSYTNQYTKPFNEITSVITEFQNSIASAARVFEFLDQETLPDEEGKGALYKVQGDVEFENVSFSYVPEQKLIDRVSIKARQGMRIAIVGPTGCGKTTLINLLMRFYDVKGGKIKIDGRDISTVTRESLRENIGMVLQDTWLIKGTIRDNIAFAMPDATDEEIISAAKEAHAHSFIKRMPKGYNTMVEEGGGNLSQGQKQLLCIARVMLSLPPMLILDEATSSIDTMTEIRVQRAFEKMMRGRTSFIVAHRLSTIKEADLILVMRDGNIVEQGTHDELLLRGGFYRELYYSQFANQ